MANDFSALRAYVRGRAAASDNQLGEAARQFQIALKDGPEAKLLRQRTFGLALLSGNEKLSRELAAQLEADGDIGIDTRLVLLSSALQAKDWKRAQSIRDELAKNNQFTFVIPIVDAWLAVGTGGDALAPVVNIGRSAVANAYAAEHRALLLGALGRTDDAVAAFQPLISGDSGRAMRMKLAAAAVLQRAGRRDAARDMLSGDSPTLRIALAQVNSGRPIASGVFIPATGVAELFARLSADLASKDVPQVSLAIARLATFLAPKNGEVWLVMADILSSDGKHEAALVAVDNIAIDDPFFPQARALKIALLQRLKRNDEALATAASAAQAKDAGAGEWVQYADVLSALDRNAEAADAYTRAIQLTPEKDLSWSHFLLRGGAYERAGNWKDAEPDLRRAASLAPDQAVALNYLGYALLDRGIKLEEAQRLIERASALKPDDGAITDSLAWVYYRRGNYTRAIELLEKAIRSEPAEPTINEHLGDAYWHVGRKLEARYSWRAAIVGADDEKALERLKRKVDWGLDLPSSGKP